MTLTNTQMFITILVMALGTALTRFLPFIIFPEGKKVPAFINELQTLLPCAVIGLLVVFCLKDISIFEGSRGLPELISMVFITILHYWRKNVLLSIAGGTVLYMLLVQMVF